MARYLDILKGEDSEGEEQEFVAKKSANVVLWFI